MNEANQILSKIATVQLKALRLLRDDPEQITDHPLAALLKIQIPELEDKLDEEIELYRKIESDPIHMSLLTPYQIGICSYILFRMELEWILDNPDGVMGAWNKLELLLQMQSLVYAN